MTFLDQLPPVRPMPTARHHAARRQLVDVANGTTRLGWRFGRGVTVSVGIGLAVAGGAGAAALLPSKGPVPISSSGSINWSKVPDFVSIVSDGKTVGYAPRGYVIGNPPGSKQSSDLGTKAVPIYASDLKTLVGHVYPGVGFVPLGESPSSVPCMVEPTPSDSPPGTVPCPSVSVALPNVVGMSTPQAAATLSNLGFEVNVVNVPRASGASGVIVAMAPRPGPSVPARTIVTIENSVSPAVGRSTNGAAITTVPSVIGLSVADATNKLSEVGLTWEVVLKASSSAPPGQILSQAPVAGAKAVSGLVMTLTESTGPAGQSG